MAEIKTTTPKKVKKETKKEIKNVGRFSRLKAEVILYNIDLKMRKTAYEQTVTELESVIKSNKHLSNDVIDILKDELEYLKMLSSSWDKHIERRKERRKNRQSNKTK